MYVVHCLNIYQTCGWTSYILLHIHVCVHACQPSNGNTPPWSKIHFLTSTFIFRGHYCFIAFLIFISICRSLLCLHFISFHFFFFQIYSRSYTHYVQLKCLFNSHLHGNVQLPTLPVASKHPPTLLLLQPLQLLIGFLVHQKKKQHGQALWMQKGTKGI